MKKNNTTKKMIYLGYVLGQRVADYDKEDFIKCIREMRDRIFYNPPLNLFRALHYTYADSFPDEILVVFYDYDRGEPSDEFINGIHYLMMYCCGIEIGINSENDISDVLYNEYLSD